MQSDNSISYSVAELLALDLPGYPRTRQGWDTLVKRGKWPSREVKGLGGPGGIRNEYKPPPDVMALIEARQRGDLPAASKPAPRMAKPVEVTENDYIDLTPPVIGGAAAKCPDCGVFVGYLKIDGRVRLEFDSPGGIVLMKIMAALQPAFSGDADALYDLSLRAYAVLSMLTAGSEDSIDNLLSNSNLVLTLSAFCKELNVTPPHIHPSKSKT